LVRVLVVDDHAQIRRLMAIYLEREGFDVCQAEHGREALLLLEQQVVDLLVVDIMMPKVDGYELVDRLRRSLCSLPVLMVTAKDTFGDKKRGFEVGVDDYLTKPVDMDELVLRVKALLRRAKINLERRIVMGELVIDADNLSVYGPQGEIALPKKEFQLLFKLLSYPKRIFTRQELLDHIWGYDSEVDERTVDVHIKRLREKFADCREFEIVTVRGLGYKAERHS